METITSPQINNSSLEKNGFWKLLHSVEFYNRFGVLPTDKTAQEMVYDKIKGLITIAENTKTQSEINIPAFNKLEAVGKLAQNFGFEVSKPKN